MELSHFLAQLFGLYMLIVAAISTMRREQFDNAVRDLFSSSGMLLIAGATSLFFGLAIVIAHPYWHANWRVVITLLGYLAILKGIMRLAFPEHAKKIADQILIQGYWVRVVVLFGLGLFLTFHGLCG